MAWPTDQDYNEALQNLATNCGDPLLQQGEAVRNSLGLLMPYSGGFADVYAIKSPDGRMWAVKCFKKQTPGLHERYELIDAHLKSVKLPFTVPFAYVEQGLRIRGEWYPIVRMEWVEGKRLNDFVTDACEKPQFFDQLAELWPKVAQRLQAANLAHADLQHGNVLLVPREDGSLSLKLIDYDGMFVPAFAGQRSSELGHGCFQHPQRSRDKIFSADVDRFSHLVIYTALRCLRVAGKELWQRYENGDNLLFRESDFVAPGKSPLLQELWRIGNPPARTMVGRLVLATQQPLGEVPWLYDLVQGREVKPLEPREAGRVQELLGQAPAAKPAAGETIETALAGTRRGTQPAPTQPAGSRPTGTQPAATRPMGTQPAGNSAAAPTDSSASPEAPPLNPAAKLWRLYRDNMLLTNVSVVGLLTVCTLVGALLNSGKKPVVEPVAPGETATATSTPDPPPQEPPPAAWVDFRLQRTMEGQSGELLCVAYSPDGRYLAAGFVDSDSLDNFGNRDTKVLIWEVTSGSLHRTLEELPNLVTAVTFSPDGQTLAVATSDGTLGLWNVTTGARSRLLSNGGAGGPAGGPSAGGPGAASNRSINSLVFGPDGQSLVASSNYGIELWDIATGNVIPKFEGQLAYSVASSPDGRTLAFSGGPSGGVTVGDVTTGTSRQSLAEPDGLVSSVAFSPDGRYLAAGVTGLGGLGGSGGGGDGKVVICEVATGAIRQTLEGHTLPVSSIAFSADGQTLASGSQDRTIKLWDVATGTLRQTLEGFPNAATFVGFSPDGQTLASGSGGNEGTIKLWTKAPAEATPSGDPEGAPEPLPIALRPQYQETETLTGHADDIYSLAFSRDGRTLVSGCYDGTISLWDATAGDVRQSLAGHEFGVLSVAVSPDGQTIASGGVDQTVKLWDAATGNLRETLIGHGGIVEAVAFSPDGQTLASSGRDRTILLWDATTGALRQTLSGHDGEVNAVAFSRDGRMLASGSDDATVKFWDATTGELRQTLASHAARVSLVAFSPDSQTLASGSDDRTIKLWDAATGELQRTIANATGPQQILYALAYAPDGSVLASGSTDGTVTLWDAVSGEVIQSLVAQSASLDAAIGGQIGVYAIAFSPDGQTLACGGNDSTITLWRTEAGLAAALADVPAPPGSTPSEESATLEGHASDVRTLAFSPDGQTLASGSADKTIKLWDPATRDDRLTISGHTMTVNSVAFSPDGQLLASGSQDQTIKLWDVATGVLRQTLAGHSRTVRCVAFSPDGQMLASGSEDRTIKFWDVATGVLLRTWEEQDAASFVHSVAFSPDGQTLAFCVSNKIKLWDVASGEVRQTLTGHALFVTSVVFSPDGQLLASGSSDKTIKLWDVMTGALRQTLTGHSGMIRGVAFSPDGRTLASGSDDRTIKLWDVASGAVRQTLAGHASWVGSVAFSPDGQVLASGSEDRTIKLWPTAAGQAAADAAAPVGPPTTPLPTLLPFAEGRTLEGHTNQVFSIAFAPDGRTLASGGYDGAIKFWDVESGALQQSVDGQEGYALCVAFSPDGQTLASRGDDNSIKLWNAVTRVLRQTLDGQQNVACVAFSPDGQTLASGSHDNTVKLWDVTTGTLRQTLEGHADSVLSVAFSPDGQTLASGSWDRTIKLWDVATGELRQTLQGHTHAVGSVAFSPDGQTLASGSYDKTIRLWDVATGELSRSLQGHTADVNSVAFSPDGQTLASGSHDLTIKLWDVATGQHRQTLEGHANLVLTVAFSPDGQTLASGSTDRTIKLWSSSADAQLDPDLPPGAGAAPAAMFATGVSEFREARRLEDHKGAVRGLAFAGTTLVSSGTGPLVLFHNMETGGPPDARRANANVTSLAVSRDGQVVAAGLQDGYVFLADTVGAGNTSFVAHAKSVTALAFSPDGSLLATGSSDRTAIVWDRFNGGQRFQINGHSDDVLAVAFSPDGQVFATGSKDKTIGLWSATTGQAVQELTGHTGPVWSVAFSPDGRTLVSAGGDRTVRLWDAVELYDEFGEVERTSWQLRQTLKQHGSAVAVVAFSPDGRLIVSGGSDKKVLVWDAATGELMQTLTGHAAAVWSLTFNSDGQALASGDNDGKIILWQLTPVSAPVDSPNLTTVDPAQPSADLTLAERLQQRISFTIEMADRVTLAEAIQKFAAQTGLPLQVLAEDLKLEGVTQNQVVSLDERDQPAGQVLRKLLLQVDSRGEVVYVVRPAVGRRGESLVVTTQNAAAARGETVAEE